MLAATQCCRVFTVVPGRDLRGHIRLQLLVIGRKSVISANLTKYSLSQWLNLNGQSLSLDAKRSEGEGIWQSFIALGNGSHIDIACTLWQELDGVSTRIQRGLRSPACAFKA